MRIRAVIVLDQMLPKSCGREGGCFGVVQPSRRPTAPGPVNTGDSHSCNCPTGVPGRPYRTGPQCDVQKGGM